MCRLGICRISLPRFLAECPKRRQDQEVFEFIVLSCEYFPAGCFSLRLPKLSKDSMWIVGSSPSARPMCVTRGQYSARPTVTCPTAEQRFPLADTKLHCNDDRCTCV